MRSHTVSVEGDLFAGEPFDSRELLGDVPFPTREVEVGASFQAPDGLFIKVTVEVIDPEGAAADVASDIIDIAGRYIQDVSSVTGGRF